MQIWGQLQVMQGPKPSTDWLTACAGPSPVQGHTHTHTHTHTVHSTGPEPRGNSSDSVGRRLRWLDRRLSRDSDSASMEGLRLPRLPAPSQRAVSEPAAGVRLLAARGKAVKLLDGRPGSIARGALAAILEVTVLLGELLGTGMARSACCTFAPLALISLAWLCGRSGVSASCWCKLLSCKTLLERGSCLARNCHWPVQCVCL